MSLIPRKNTMKFTAAHHAMLFSCLSESVVAVFGYEKAGELLRKAVRKYGEERGRRMALRAEADGRPLTMLNYIAYSEWEAGPGEMKQKIVKRSPHAEVNIPVCPWHSAWEKSGKIEYGRFFCLEIDRALLAGFNPDLKLDVGCIHTDGCSQCEFTFHDADLSLPRLALLAFRKKISPGKNVLMPWEYHLGHLYKTIHTSLSAESGKKGAMAVESGMISFADLYGESAAAAVESYLHIDFSQLPG